jgi:diguanylate cyclase (GGDEF)-like protein
MKREIATSISLMRDQDGKKVGFMGIVRDVDEQKKYEKQLIHAAYHDTLTGLKNRKAFYNRLDDTLLHAKRYQHDISLIYIDLDNFKQVNDTLGHEAGDELLRQIAKRLTNCLRKTDFVSRIGGDEFTVIMDNFNSATPEAVALKINETLSATYTVSGSTVNHISSSIGISMFPKDASNSDELIRMADAAMYRAKKERNSCISCGAI